LRVFYYREISYFVRENGPKCVFFRPDHSTQTRKVGLGEGCKRLNPRMQNPTYATTLRHFVQFEIVRTQNYT